MAEHGLIAGTLNRSRQIKKPISLVLLFILLTSATASVTSVLISPDWGSLWRGLVYGLLLGWFLAVLRQPAWRVAIIVLAVSISYALLFVGGLNKYLSVILINLAGVTPLSRTSNFPSEALTAIGEQLMELFKAALVIIERVQTWLLALGAGEVAFDPTVAALIWSILVWIIAAWAGWVAAARKNALLAVLPAILLSVGALSYSGRESFALYMILGCTLLLLAMIQHNRREQAWDESQIAYPPRKARQVGNFALFLALGLVACSAILSSISLPRIMEWISAQREPISTREDDIGKSLGILPGATPTPDPFGEVRSPGLPRAKLIGSGPELSHQSVMTVVVDGFPNIFRSGQVSPFYWRGYTYDVYTGHGWRTSGTSSDELPANHVIQPEQGTDHILLHQTIRSTVGEVSVLHAAGEPVSVDRPSRAAWRSPADLFGVQIGTAVSYQARSLFPIPSESTLRAAGQRYPAWVTRRYLSLPGELPGRVEELAIQLTASEPTPYDRAKAIERYLRTFPYTLDLPHTPLDQDLVDYFLFDLRKGYCDYYASAMVVLARAAGVPARIATGYANGVYNLNSKRFMVSEADAHTWVEVYFPDIGWVHFEPTAARPSWVNDQAQAPVATQNPASSKEDLGINAGAPNRLWVIFLGGLAATGIAGILWTAYDEIYLRRLTETAGAVEVFRRMRRYAKFLGLYIEHGNTPLESAWSLVCLLQGSSAKGNIPGYLQGSLELVAGITDKIMQISYSPHSLKGNEKDLLLQQWKVLRWQLRLFWLKRRVNSLFGFARKVFDPTFRHNPEESILEI